MREGSNLQPHSLGTGGLAVRGRGRFRAGDVVRFVPHKQRVVMDKEAKETFKGVLTYGIGVAVLVGFVVAIGGCQL